MIGLALVWGALAADAVPAPVPEPPATADPQAVEDARVRGLVLQLNRARMVYLEEGLAIVDQAQRHCTSAWAEELLQVRGAWDVQSEQLLLELQRPGGEWAPRAREAVLSAAMAEIEAELDAAEAAYVERVRLMHQLMTRCPEHDKALQGIYALGKHSFIVG